MNIIKKVVEGVIIYEACYILKGKLKCYIADSEKSVEGMLQGLK